MEDFAAFDEYPEEAQAPSQPAQPKAQYYIDEEEALGFHIWVAELELLLGQVKGSRANIEPVAALELLQKLLVTIDSSQRDRVREYQRRCEEALTDVLLKGAAPPVRRLICACLVQIYVVGDTLPLYSRVASLQSYLGSKEASNRGSPEAARLGALQALAALSDVHGRSLASSALESLTLAVKFTARYMDAQTKMQALQLIAAIIRGLGDRDRNVVAIQSDALKAAVRVAKEAATAETCLAAAGVLRSLAQAGGAALWANGAKGYEEAVQLSLTHLEDASRATGDAFAGALGDLVAASKSDAALQAVHMPKLKPARKAALEKLLQDSMSMCLERPFIEAAQADRRRSLRAMSQAWISYMATVQSDEDEGVLVDLAIKAIEMLAAVKPAADRGTSDGDSGAGLSCGELPMAQATVLCILRVGIIERLSETGQRRLLERLVALAASVIGSQVPLAAVTLETLVLLLEILGEVPPETAQLLRVPLTQKLTCQHSLLRMQAAATLAALAAAEPGAASELLVQHLDGLQVSAKKLAELASSEAATADKQLQIRGSGKLQGLAGPDPDQPRQAMDAVQGHSLGASALLVTATRLPLGMPSRLRQRALELAEGLIRTPGSSRADGQGAEREAGYIMLGALCASGLPKGQKRAEVLDLWSVALSADSAAQLDIRRFVEQPSQAWDTEMAAEMWWRASALEALQAFIQGPLSQAGKAEARRLQETVAEYLAPMLDIITAMPAIQDPGKSKGGPNVIFAAAASLLQLRLLEAYLALPDASAFTMEHAAVSKLCARALRSVPGQAASGIAESVASSALRQALDKQDDVLGPWVPGRDPLEDALAAYAGAPGGPLHHPWQAGSPFSAGYSDSDNTGDILQSPVVIPSIMSLCLHGLQSQKNYHLPHPPLACLVHPIFGLTGAQAKQRSFQPLPQPRSLAAALLEMQLTLLGSLLAIVSQANQLQILEVLNVAATEGSKGKSRRERSDPNRRHTLVTCACAAALAGLDTLARKYRGELGSRDEVAHKAGALADSVLNVAADCNDAALQRSAAEIFAFAACIGSTPFAAGLVRTLVQALADSPSAPRRAALAVAVGSIVRSKGGIALQSTLNLTAGTLLAAAQVCPGPAQLWLLHGMWLIVNSAGPAFLPHVTATLRHAVEALMLEENSAVPGLQPAVGRLANALVAVLGPELTLGSPAYCSCRALIREMQAISTASGRPEDAAAAALETVSYAQMLVLFAPQAVPAIAHLPLLLDTLPSRQPSLRRAAALTLRHLAERDPAAILPEKVEGRLFDALDAETDTEIASQLRATLATLLSTGAPAQPSYWLQVCSQVALAAVDRSQSGPGAAGASGSGAGFRGGLDESLMEGTADEEDEAAGGPATSAAPKQQPALLEQGSMGSQGMRLGTAPRLRTRLFAAQCILEIPESVGADTRHFYPAEAAASSGADWLVQSLQSMIDAGFKMATGQVEALRPLGVQLLKAVLAKFGDAKDPLLPEHLLLEQFQAQYISALRSALSAKGSPVLLGAGASLAAAFLERRMAAGDPVVLQRLMRLLTAPLAAMDDQTEAQHQVRDFRAMAQEVYAEWVGAQARVALLEAHAECRAFAAGLPDQATNALVTEAQQPYERQLSQGWAGMLTDWAALGSLSADQAARYQSAWMPDAALPEPVPDQAKLARAAPALLVALAATLSNMQEAAKPLAAVAAVASHRLLSVATEAFASGRPQCPSNGHRPAAESSSLALMLSALASLRALVTARLPVLDVPVVANVVKLLHQLLDKVLAPALAIPAEPEEEVPLTGLLAAIADILAAVCSQPTWQELHPDTALAALSAMNIAATSDGAGAWHGTPVTPNSALHASFGAARALVAADASFAGQFALAALRVLQQAATGDAVKEAQAFLAHVLPVLAAANLSLAAATLRAAADIAVASVSSTAGLESANGAMAAAHIRVAAVMSLITSHGHLLHTPASEESAVPAAQPVKGSAQDSGHAQSRGSLKQGSAAAPAAPGDEAAALPHSAEQHASTEAAASAAKQDTDDPDLAVSDNAAEDLQSSPPEGQVDAAVAAHGDAAGEDAPDSEVASTAGERQLQEGFPERAEQEAHLSSVQAGVAEARHHCIMALDACILCTSQAGMQLAALHAVGSQMRVAAADKAQGRLQWAADCFAAVAPSAVVDARRLLQPPSVASAEAPTEQVVSGILALLVAALTLFPDRQLPIMAVLLVLLIEAAAPEGEPNVAVKAAALKLVNSLAGSQHAPVFQAAVTQLPQSAKQRLQGALKAASSSQSAQLSKVQKQTISLGTPVIKLQNFAAMQ